MRCNLDPCNVFLVSNHRKESRDTMDTFEKSERILELAARMAKDEGHLPAVQQAATNHLIRRYAAATGFDIETATRLVEVEARCL